MISHLHFQLHEVKARSLLNQFKWDTEKLFETIFDGGRKAQELLKNSWKKVPFDAESSLDCLICLETVAVSNQIKVFPCNHRFCLECLTIFIKTEIIDNGGLLSTLRCPGGSCLYEIEDKLVFDILKDSALKAIYQKIIANSFVEVTSLNMNNQIYLSSSF